MPGFVCALRGSSDREGLHLRYFVLSDFHFHAGALLESLSTLWHVVSIIALRHILGDRTLLAESASTTPDLYWGSFVESCLS